MGVDSQKELEALLRENIKNFCASNFQFEHELRVSGNISFFADDRDAVTCSVDGTFPPPEVPPPPVTRGRGRPRKNALRPVTPVRGRAQGTRRAKKDSPPGNVKSEPSPSESTLKTVRGEEAAGSGTQDVTVACPIEAEGEAKAEVPQDDEEPDVEDNDDRGSDQESEPQTKAQDAGAELKSPGKHTCSFCGKVYPKPNRLRIHERTHTGERPYSCLRCGKTYRSAASLKNHKKIGCVDMRKKGALKLLAQKIVEDLSHEDDVDERPPPKRRDCKFCGRTFSKPSRLQTHERTHTGERPFSCTKCGKAYVSLQGLRTHHIRGCADRRKKQAREQQPKKPPPKHICGHCGKVYAKRNRMLIHERTQHTGERPYLCATCGKSYASKMTLNQHTLLHTKDKNYVCSVCNARFLLPYTLKVHMRVHTGERPHVCWHCGRTFRQYGSFQVHLRTHTKEKPLKCSKCDERFAHRSLQLKHEMMHEGERKFNCAQCEKRFWTAHELKTHQRTHLGIRRHVCPQCGQRFTQISSLKRHMEGHNGGNKTHACPVCGKTFTRSHQVSIHMKVHMPDSPYRCQICRTNFKSLASRRVHMQTHHPGQQEVHQQVVVTNVGELMVSSVGEVVVSSTGDENDPTVGLVVVNQPPHEQHEENPYRALLLDQHAPPHPAPSAEPQPPLTHNIQFVNTIGSMPHTIAQTMHHVPEPAMYHHDL